MTLTIEKRKELLRETIKKFEKLNLSNEDMVYVFSDGICFSLAKTDCSCEEAFNHLDNLKNFFLILRDKVIKNRNSERCVNDNAN